MKTTFRKLVTLSICAFVVQFSQAQDFGQILAGGAEDAETYFANYLEPGLNSFGLGMANGWYNTGKPHKFLGFDVTATVSVPMVPTSDQTFTFDSETWNSFEYSGSQNDDLPTLAGGEGDYNGGLFIDAGKTIDAPNGSTITIPARISFPIPEGVDAPVDGVPTPVIQGSVGLFKGTEVIVRGTPTTFSTGDLELSFFGFGIKHDIKQWIPGMKLLPFDLSALFGTTTLNVEKGINLRGGNAITQSDPSTNSTTTFSGGGTAEFEAKATTFQLIASKKLLLLTPYVGVGINQVKTSAKIKGAYRYEVETNGITQELPMNDPVDITFDGVGGPTFTAGLRVKILIATAHVQYTLQEYSTIAAGVGIALR